MIKFLVLFLFFINLNASELLRLHVNKNHGLLTFVESLCDVRYSSKAVKRYYNLKSANTNSNDLQKLKNLHYTISKSAIYNHKKTRSLLEALYLDSIKFNSFANFKNHIFKYRASINKKILNDYFGYIEKYKKSYEKIIWNKNLKKLQRVREKLKLLIQKHNLDQMIKQIAKFYKIPLDQIGEFNLALYSIPLGKNINAYRIKNLETIGVLTHKKQNLNWLLTATILHEVSHTLYFKSDFIKKHFMNNQTNSQKTLFQEVFATAIGAGWGYENITGKTTLTPWYNNKHYDNLSRKIFSKLKEYLDSSKQIDKEFISFMKENI